MTLEQLRIFIAVAEREHVTRAAQALHMTQSAVSGAIAALEARHGVALFHRVGRRIELTDSGRLLLDHARGILARVQATELALSELGGLERGTLRLVASQTIASYWLPPRLAAFHQRYPGIDLSVALANTEGAANAVLQGTAELGFVEGAIDDPALARWVVDRDPMRIVGTVLPAAVDDAWIMQAPWIMREPGSGTRAVFEQWLRTHGLDPDALDVVLTLPSNEAILSAVRVGAGYAFLSDLVVAPALKAGAIVAPPFDPVERPFFGLRQKERYRSKAADAFLDLAVTRSSPIG